MFLVPVYSLGILGLYLTTARAPCWFLLFPRLACMTRPGTFVGPSRGCDVLSPNPLCRTVSMIEALLIQTPLSPVTHGRDIVCSKPVSDVSFSFSAHTLTVSSGNGS